MGRFLVFIADTEFKMVDEADCEGSEAAEVIEPMSTSDNEDEGEEEGKAEVEEDDDLESASAMMKAKRAACKRKAANGSGERIKAASCSSEGDCPE